MREREMLTVITRRRGVKRHGVTQELHPPLPTKMGYMTNVCAYALQKQACEMSHGCDMSLVQWLLPIFRLTSARISEKKKKQLLAIKTLLFISVMLKADQHFLLLPPPQKMSQQTENKGYRGPTVSCESESGF